VHGGVLDKPKTSLGGGGTAGTAAVNPVKMTERERL